MCISWTVKCSILLMHGATMKYRKIVCEISLNCIWFHTFHMSLNRHFPICTFIIVSTPCYVILYLTSIPTPCADRFGFSIRPETYVCSNVAMQVLLFDTILSTLLRFTYQNRTEGTRKFHTCERFLLIVRWVTWNQLHVRAAFVFFHANVPFI